MRAIFKGKDLTLVASWARGIFFSNKNTSLSADNVQGAIEELDDKIIYDDFSFTKSETAGTVGSLAEIVKFNDAVKTGYTPIAVSIASIDGSNNANFTPFIQESGSYCGVAIYRATSSAFSCGATLRVVYIKNS